MSARAPLCDSCKSQAAIAKVEGTGPTGTQWLCRACVADLLRHTSPNTQVEVQQAAAPSSSRPAPLRPALSKNAPVTFQPLGGVITAVQLPARLGVTSVQSDAAVVTNNDDDVSEDSDDDANDAAQLETRRFAAIPVERLLQSIAARADAATTVSDAKRAAVAMRTRAKARDVCGECEVIVLPRQAGAALRFRGVGVLLLSADCVLLKLHAKGRPSGALVLTLNTILSELGGFARYSVCPSGGEELLLLDSVKNTRVSCDRQRELEATAASTARRDLVRQQSLTLLGEAPPKPSGKAPTKPTGDQREAETNLRAALHALEADATTPVDDQWSEQNPQFSKIMYYWAKRTMLGALCHEADRAFKDQKRDVPFVRAATTNDCLVHCAALMKQRIEKETTPGTSDYRPKTAFIKSNERLMYVLDKLFGSDSRALKMQVPFVELLFRMESHWVQLRGKLIGTMKQPRLDDLTSSSSSTTSDAPPTVSRRHTSQLATTESSKSSSSKRASSIQATAEPLAPPPPTANAWLSVDVDNVDAILAAYRAQNGITDAKPGRKESGADSLTRGESKAKPAGRDEHTARPERFSVEVPAMFADDDSDGDGDDDSDVDLSCIPKLK